MSNFSEIISFLPYRTPFHFVDKLIELSDDHVIGTYKIKKDEYFFRGHFPENPIVPGAILAEIMAQIGLVCMGIHLTSSEERPCIMPAFTSMELDFLSFARPENTLTIRSEKIYFRLGKLKCKVSCKKEDGTLVAKGQLSGVIVKQKN